MHLRFRVRGSRLTVSIAMTLAMVVASCSSAQRLGPETKCEAFLRSPTEQRDQAVKRIALEQQRPDAGNPMLRLSVEQHCGQQPDEALGSFFMIGSSGTSTSASTLSRELAALRVRPVLNEDFGLDPATGKREDPRCSEATGGSSPSMAIELKLNNRRGASCMELGPVLTDLRITGPLKVSAGKQGGKEILVPIDGAGRTALEQAAQLCALNDPVRCPLGSLGFVVSRTSRPDELLWAPQVTSGYTVDPAGLIMFAQPEEADRVIQSLEDVRRSA